MTRLRRIAAGVAVAISLVLCASPMQTAWGQELRAFDADIRDLERKRADILRKLEHLIARLPTETSKSKSFKHRKAYAERILELRKALRRLDGERRELLEEVANVPRIPPLKLVEVVGSKDKQSNNFSTYGGPEIWQIAYKRGSNGYTAKIIKSVRDTYWTVSFVVTSAPLEIIPGRPFDIEGQVKIRYQYSTSPRARPCAESPSIKVGLRIRHFSDDVWRYAPTELKCSGNATLDLRLRFTPVRQKWIRGADRWETSYRSSVSGGGVISEEADGKGKRQAFEIRSFRYPPFRHDRGVEPYDFSFQIEPLFYYLPPIKFFYPPLRPGERAVTSLGNYRHPRLLDRPPDVANIEVPDVRSFKVDGAKRRLQILGLKTKTKSAGRPARRMDADRVTRQDPKPGTKVKTGTTVTLSHYTAYVPTRSELVRDMQRQCDRVKGAIAYWESRLNSPRCRCAKGMQLNRAKTACVKIRATTTSRRSTESGRSSGQRRSEPAWSCTDVLGEIRRRAGSGDRAGAARLADDPRTRAACPRGAIDQAMSAPAGYPRAGSRRDDTQARVQRARRCTAALAEIRKRTGRGDFLGATQVANDRRTREACPRREIDQALKTPARPPVSKSTSRRQTGTFTGCRWVALSRPGYGAGSAHECRCDQGTIRSTPQRFCGPQPRVVQPKRKAPSTTTTGRRPGTGGRLTPSNDKCFCKDPATGRYYEGLLGGCHGIESIDKKWCTPPPGAR